MLVEAVAPPGAPELDPDDPAVDRFVEFLDGWGASVISGTDTWSARIALEARSVTDAITDATCVVGETAAKAGLPKWPVLRVEALEWAQLEAELSRPNFPDIMGSGEVIAELGVTKQRLWQLRNGGDFPAPIVELSATPIWLRPAIESFKDRWNRKRGRPAHSGPGRDKAPPPGGGGARSNVVV